MVCNNTSIGTVGLSFVLRFIMMIVDYYFARDSELLIGEKRARVAKATDK